MKEIFNYAETKYKTHGKKAMMEYLEDMMLSGEVSCLDAFMIAEDIIEINKK